MNIIQENLEKFREIVNQKRYNINAFCTEILKIAPNQNIDWLSRDFCKYIAYMALNINPSSVDLNTENVINEFLNQTKMLKDFSKLKVGELKDFLETQNEASRACFGVYICRRMTENNKNFSFDANDIKTKGGSYILGLLGIPSFVSEPILDGTGGGFLDQFFNWLGGSGGGGNQVVGKIYYFWKYWPGQPYHGRDRPTKEDISENFKKGWIPKIEAESGVNHDVLERYFERDYNKIKFGYYKVQEDWFKTVRKEVDDNLRNGKQPYSGSRSGGLLSFFKNLFS